MMGIASNDDTQSIANVIAASGGTTTYMYPDTSSGDTTYHLTVTADGPWTVTITQVNG